MCGSCDPGDALLGVLARGESYGPTAAAGAAIGKPPLGRPCGGDGGTFGVGVGELAGDQQRTGRPAPIRSVDGEQSGVNICGAAAAVADDSGQAVDVVADDADDAGRLTATPTVAPIERERVREREQIEREGERE